MNHISFLKLLCTVLFLVKFGIKPLEVASQQPNKPNIIWIMTEDIGHELGCYNYPFVRTPNLDDLATQGRRYTNMYATSPVCSGSRSAMITGMYQTSIDAQDHRSHRNDGYQLPTPVKPITTWLKQAGYFTVNANATKEGKPKGPGTTDYNFNTTDTIFDGFDWQQRKPGQPLYAQIMISVTHRGPIWKTLDSTPPSNLKLPPYYPDHPIAKADWTRFLKSIELMDVYVGAILKQLKTDGILNNAVIIFSSDHGRCMVRDKQFIYDGGIQIPCIISWPGNLKAGSMDNNLHSSIDISASILDIAGIQRPPYMEGISFIGNNIQPRNYIVAARDRMDETVDKMRCVRTNQFKYIKNYYPERAYMQPNKYKETEYPVWNLLKDLKKEGKLTPEQLLFTQDAKPTEELYDIIKDPYELHNLAGNNQYRTQLKKMRKILQNWIKETGDKGQ